MDRPPLSSIPILLDTYTLTPAAAAASRLPLHVLNEIGETAAMNEFASLTAAAQLAQESQMGNMIETTRSAPTPCASGMMEGTSHGPTGGMTVEDREMQLAFQNLVSDSSSPPPNATKEQNDAAAVLTSTKARVRTRQPITTTASSRSVDPTRRRHIHQNQYQNQNQNRMRPSTTTTTSSSTSLRAANAAAQAHHTMAATTPTTTTYASSSSLSSEPVTAQRPSPSSPSPPVMNDYTRMQETLGMQHLQAPTGSSQARQQQQQSHTRASSSQNSSQNSTSSQSRTGRMSASSSFSQQDATATRVAHGDHVSGGRRSGSVKNADAASESIHSAASHSAANISQGETSVDQTAGPSVAPTANAAVESSAASGGGGGGDPAADEQYQIWQQIQADLEQKEMQLALQLSQKERNTKTPGAVVRNAAPDSTTRCGDRGGVGGSSSTSGDYAYPDQHGKPSRNNIISSSTPADDSEEDEALKEILRISQEEAAAAEAARNQASEDEDEIALALQLSKKQAEEDQKRLQRLQETAGELSEEEQIRLAMEQSMQPLPQDDLQDSAAELRLALEESMQQPSRTEEHFGISETDENSTVDDDMDDDMKLAMRLSEAQLFEEEQYRHSFYKQQPRRPKEDPVRPRHEDIIMGPEAFADSIQAFPSEDPQPPLSSHSARPSNMPPPGNSRPLRAPPSPGLDQLHVSRDRSRWGERDVAQRQSWDPPRVHRPVHPELPFQDFSVQPLPDSSAHPVRAPDDGSDALPASRPQRKTSEEEKDSSLKLSSRHETRPRSRSSSFDVDVDNNTRIAMVREGQLDTRMAIMQGQSQIVTCQGCTGKLHAPTQCSLVFCPTCNTVSPVEHGCSTA